MTVADRTTAQTQYGYDIVLRILTGKKDVLDCNFDRPIRRTGRAGSCSEPGFGLGLVGVDRSGNVKGWTRQGTLCIQGLILQ